ncbi:hypothetical protein EJB05_43453, partial [Eragrostis curvula]
RCEKEDCRLGSYHRRPQKDVADEDDEGEEDDDDEEGEGEGEEEDDLMEDEEAAEEEEEEGEKWLKHYSSMQSILLVGDGDFSSLALATAFRSGANLTATSLDTYEDLKAKYSKAESNIAELKRLGTSILHGVDVEPMRLHTELKSRRFDRIVFNFPHAGFKGKEDQVYMINLHKKLVSSFFNNAFHMLHRYGEIHVSHKMGQPYDRWELEHLAAEASLIMFEKVCFQKEDYPGYDQKRGSGPRCDQPFVLGPCYTFKFQIGDFKKHKKPNQNSAGPFSLIGGHDARADNLENNIRPFHLPPLVQAPWPHFSPVVNTIRIITALQHCVVVQMQQPGFLLNLNGALRALYVHQQGTIQRMHSMPGPSPNGLPSPEGIPAAMGRIVCPNLLARQEQSWYMQRTIADPAGGGNCSYFDYQRCLQREHEMQRQMMMPGSTGLNYSSAFLEGRHRESVGAAGLNYSSAFLEDRCRESVGAAGLSYSSAFLEDRCRESVGTTGLSYSSAFLENRRKESVGATGLSYSSAFLEDRRKEYVQK